MTGEAQGEEKAVVVVVLGVVTAEVQGKENKTGCGACIEGGPEEGISCGGLKEGEGCGSLG